MKKSYSVLMHVEYVIDVEADDEIDDDLDRALKAQQDNVWDVSRKRIGTVNDVSFDMDSLEEISEED